jgi:hypothetical protein
MRLDAVITERAKIARDRPDIRITLEKNPLTMFASHDFATAGLYRRRIANVKRKT